MSSHILRTPMREDAGRVWVGDLARIGLRARYDGATPYLAPALWPPPPAISRATCLGPVGVGCIAPCGHGERSLRVYRVAEA